MSPFTRDGITFEVHAVCKEDDVADVVVKQDKPAEVQMEESE